MESEIHSVIPTPLTTKIRSRRCSDSLPFNQCLTSSDLKLRDYADLFGGQELALGLCFHLQDAGLCFQKAGGHGVTSDGVDGPPAGLGEVMGVHKNGLPGGHCGG